MPVATRMSLALVCLVLAYPDLLFLGIYLNTKEKKIRVNLLKYRRCKQ